VDECNQSYVVTLDDARADVCVASAQDMKGLSQATVEAAFIQFAAHNSKMEQQEYLNFAKVNFTSLNWNLLT
jgi:hypothetical protein